MAINRSFISTEPVSSALTRIEIVAQRPSTEGAIDPPETPLRIVGYYNQQLDAVELFVVNQSGLRWIRV